MSATFSNWLMLVCDSAGPGARARPARGGERVDPRRSP